MLTNRDLLTKAMQNNQRLRIKYTNNAQKTTIRDISPLRWEGKLIVALCYDVNKELTLNPDSMEIMDSSASNLEHETIKPGKNTYDAAHASGPTNKITKEPKKEEIAVTPSVTPLGDSFKIVETREQWKRLIKYYIKCLHLENARNGVVTQSGAMFFPLDDDSAKMLLDGHLQLTFDAESDKQSLEYITDPRRRDQQLFFGYPLLILPNNEMAPLLFTPIIINSTEEKTTLQAEEAEINYAALQKLGIADEDIESIINSLTSSESVYSINDKIEGLINELEQKLGITFHRIIQTYGLTLPNEVKTIYEGPCFFWSEAIYTGSLLEELASLADPDKWSGPLPQALQVLFNNTNEHRYPTAEPITQDKIFYASRVNDQQRQAVLAAQTELITVVTGPPGTGKSQLILNIIADAVVRGERVLFASRNNEAVDVVVRRLHQELKFYGAVRAGNQKQTGAAANLMLQMLDEAANTTLPTIEPIQSEYQEVKYRLDEQEVELQRMITARNTERDLQQQHRALLDRLPEPFRIAVQTYNHQLRTKKEKDILDQLIDPLIEKCRSLKTEFEKLQHEIIAFSRDTNEPLIAVLHKFEAEQNLRFCEGILHQKPFESIIDSKQYLQKWLFIVRAIAINRKIDAQQNQIAFLDAEYQKRVDELPHELRINADFILKSFTEDNNNNFIIESNTLLQLLQKANSRSRSILKYFAKSKLQLAQEFTVLMRSIGLNLDIDESNVSAMIVALAKLIALQNDYDEISIQSTKRDQRALQLTTAIDSLPPTFGDDLHQLDLSALRDFSQVHKKLTSLEARHLNISEKLFALQRDLDPLLNPKEPYNPLIAFKVETPLATWWMKNHYEQPNATLYTLNTWKDIFSIWDILRRLERIRQEIRSLPNEERIIESLTSLRAQFVNLSRQILHHAWFSRVVVLDNKITQGARAYAEAMQGLALDKVDKVDKNTKNNYARMRVAHLPDALKVFPVWATTNLSAKSNFNLAEGLFDLVVIDEASQCDIPSALPLLYRAKRIVVIGDPQQLSHITRLQGPSQVNIRYGIDGGALGYTEKSLFSLAQGSVGNHPGTIMLNDHYRSHPRIIGYSNKEFYGEKLRILTNMSARGIPDNLIDHGTGIVWVNVQGRLEKSAKHTRSRFNPPELDALYNLLPQVLEQVDNQMLNLSTIGIVTPFRGQKEKIEEKYLNNERIKVGTAHTFQGDERDIMFFSPVLTEGMGNTLSWLENTPNLLNVALTRARNLLVIVGDWDYCNSLPTTSKYRRLADYVNELGTLYTMETFPLLKSYVVKKSANT